MRTKTLLTMAALAAGALTSMAQSNVYSLNIVGYVNTTVGFGNSLLANPLDLDGVNTADKILNIAPLSDAGGNPGLDTFYISTWNGRGFNTVYYEQDYTSGNTGGVITNGWADSTGTAQGVPPQLQPGTGFFLNNGGPVVVNTFVGSVKPAPGATNSITIGFGNNLVGSMLPVAGPVNTAFQLPIAALSDAGGNPGLDTFYVSTWNGRGYNTVYYEQDYTSGNTGGAITNGWTDATGTAQGVPPTIAVGQGFFINNGGPVTTWYQTLGN